MSSPHDDELSHPLEQVTGEKDVPPEEEEASAQQEESDAGDVEQGAPSGDGSG
ncbi:hypothetical protein [Streptomyces rishiriensis]|uniref:Uncharacterized protein n=1 Tax=Streptomyces rishiriensis TaxID=68264 RepID=A0ABU0P2U9_STRRH|nr:hypothetical protein [Streptomyces rishiriensis]MDQ0585721.1 hypothetical protein [Streptomyces rishiriensis]